MRILFIGDIFAKVGRDLVRRALPGLVRRHEIDCVIANGENAAGGFGLTRDSRVLPSTLIDKPAPDFDLPPLLPGGKGLKTADLKGQVSLVNVFASWCVPCRAEHPIWAKVTKEENLPVYGINWKDKQEQAQGWIKELGNPYARIGFDPAGLGRRPPNPDLAIRPYPAEWRRTLERGGERFELRPIRPGDALLYRDFLARTDPEDLRRRFMAVRAHYPDELALLLSQLDYDREIAFVALTSAGELAGVSRLACAPDHVSAEYALIVRSDLQGRGLGTALMRLLIDYARADGLERLEGMVLADNRGMLGLIGSLGFEIAPDPEPGVVMSRLEL